MDGLYKIITALVLIVALSGCSIPFQQSQVKDPEFYKFLTPEAREEHRELSRCIYFIKDTEEGQVITPHCK